MGIKKTDNNPDNLPEEVNLYRVDTTEEGMGVILMLTPPEEGVPYDTARYVKEDLADYEAVCDDLDRAHEHINLYIEAEERHKQVIDKLVEALKVMISAYGSKPKMTIDEAEKIGLAALALAEKARGA